MDQGKTIFRIALLAFLGLSVICVVIVNVFTMTPEIPLNTIDMISTQVSNIVDVKNSKKGFKENMYVLQESLNTFDPFSIDVPLPFLPNYKTPCFRNEYSKLYCLPYFFLLVSQKSGTTDLFFTLTRHSMITKDHQKEYHWWNRRRFPIQIRICNNLTFSEYMDWYNDTTKDIDSSVQKNSDYTSGEYHPKIHGDFTASYLYDQLQWKRYPQNAGLSKPKVLSAHAIHYILPNAKFVVILRDPSERLISDYCYYNIKKDADIFHTKVTQAIDWFKNCTTRGQHSCLYDVLEYIKPKIRWHPDISWDPVIRLRASLYSEFLTDWFKVFDRKQFYIFRFEDYIQDRLYYSNEIFKFLGLDTLPGITNAPPKRKTHSKIQIANKTKELLNTFYKPYNMKLANMLKDDRFLWDD